jgi:hypothetical protein
MAKSKTATLYSAEAVSATGTNTPSMDVRQFKEVTLLINVTAVSGTSPTLDLDLDASNDGATWYKHSDLTQLTAVAKSVAKITGNIANFIRLSSTIGGSSTPIVTLTVIAVAKEG